MAKFNISVVGFRILIDVIAQNNFDWTPSFQAHFSSFFFYFTFSCIFYVAKVNRFYNRHLIIGLIGITIEILSELGGVNRAIYCIGNNNYVSGTKRNDHYRDFSQLYCSQLFQYDKTV